jgi:hypothetical protein
MLPVDKPLPYLFKDTNYPLDVGAINAKKRKLLATYILNCYSKIQLNLERAARNDAVRPGGRGQLRRVTELSLGRIDANVYDQENWELTVERTIVASQMNRPGCNYDWYNQFNVASGIGGSDEGRRTAIDLVRKSLYCANLYDLIELKVWNSQDEPYDVGWEIVRYCLAFLILGKEREDPNCFDWPPLERAEFFVLAPDTWRPYDADEVMQLFHDALEIAGNLRPEVSCCTFWPKVLRLSGISMTEFRKMLYHPTPLNRYGNLYVNDNRIERLHKWVDDAFQEVELNRTTARQ